MELHLFNQHVTRLSNALFRFAYWKLGNRTLAEDAVQDTFMKMWLMKNKLNTYENFDALAFRILRNLCIDYYRKKKIIKVDIEIFRDIILSKDFTAQGSIELEENMKEMEEAISKLPNQQQMIFYMRNIEGWEIKDIAKTLNMNENTVSSNLSRARKGIRKLLKK